MLTSINQPDLFQKADNQQLGPLFFSLDPLQPYSKIEQKTNGFGATLPDWHMESFELNAIFASGRGANPSACTLAKFLFVSLNLLEADQP
jgi:hypothetical protein